MKHGSLDPGPTIDPLTATNHGSKEVMSDADDSVPVDRAAMRARRRRSFLIDPGAAVAPNPRSMGAYDPDRDPPLFAAVRQRRPNEKGC